MEHSDLQRRVKTRLKIGPAMTIDDETAPENNNVPARPETTQEKSARLKALRLREKDAVAARVESATRKARAKRAILG